MVAAVRSADKAADVYGGLGLKEGYQGPGRSGGILFTAPGVDVSDAGTLTADLFKGVTQVRWPAPCGTRASIQALSWDPGPPPTAPNSALCCATPSYLSQHTPWLCLPLLTSLTASPLPRLTAPLPHCLQVVSLLGPVAGRLPDGSFGYIDGMSPERVEQQGEALAQLG